MHTIEAAVLVPLGLGLMVVLIMLTFWMHDQVVLTAKYGSLALEWQSCPLEFSMEEPEAEGRITGGLLITDVSVKKITGGNVLFRLRTEESRELFRRGIALLSLGEMEGRIEREVVALAINSCWLKRIWRVSGLG